MSGDAEDRQAWQQWLMWFVSVVPDRGRDGFGVPLTLSLSLPPEPLLLCSALTKNKQEPAHPRRRRPPMLCPCTGFKVEREHVLLNAT